MTCLLTCLLRPYPFVQLVWLAFPSSFLPVPSFDGDLTSRPPHAASIHLRQLLHLTCAPILCRRRAACCVRCHPPPSRSRRASCSFRRAARSMRHRRSGLYARYEEEECRAKDWLGALSVAVSTIGNFPLVLSSFFHSFKSIQPLLPFLQKVCPSSFVPNAHMIPFLRNPILHFPPFFLCAKGGLNLFGSLAGRANVMKCW